MGFCIGQCWCVYRDILGLLVLPLGFGQIFFVYVVTIIYAIAPLYGLGIWGIINTYVLSLFACLAVWSAIRSSFTEPGIVQSKHISNQLSSQLQKCDVNKMSKNCYCSKCKLPKPVRAHHCSKCQRCVLKMDHHCPWINNCVGARNQKYFILFLFYAFVGEVYAIILGSIQLVRVWSDIRENTFLIYLKHIWEWPNKLPFGIGNKLFLPVFAPALRWGILLPLEVFFSVVFIIFLAGLLHDQYKAIKYDLTYVEYLKAAKYTPKEDSLYDCLESTMGEPFCVWWFIPVEAKQMDEVLNRLTNEWVNFDDLIDDEDEEEENEGIEDEKPVQSKTDHEKKRNEMSGASVIKQGEMKVEEKSTEPQLKNRNKKMKKLS